MEGRVVLEEKMVASAIKLLDINAQLLLGFFERLIYRYFIPITLQIKS